MHSYFIEKKSLFFFYFDKNERFIGRKILEVTHQKVSQIGFVCQTLLSIGIAVRPFRTTLLYSFNEWEKIK